MRSKKNKSNNKSEDESESNNRDYRDDSYNLRIELANYHSKYSKQLSISLIENLDESTYKKYNYNGSFHKGLQHNLVNGQLANPSEYKKMVKSIVNNDQKRLSKVKLAEGSTTKLTNPLASMTSTLIGANQCSIQIDIPPSLNSDVGAAEMVELYCLALSRDVPFINYKDDLTILKILASNRLNKPDVLNSLKYYTPLNIPFMSNTVFRGISNDEKMGPYISQLLLLDVPMGAAKMEQKYSTLLPTNINILDRTQNIINEWGITMTDTIDIQNGNLSKLQNPIVDPIKKYIFSGRSLAEAVHNDQVYQLFYQASLILMGLGAKPNSGFPNYPNQSGFVSGYGGPSVLCAIADVAGLALKHCWYWKWQVYRKLRPEVFGLWINNVKNDIVHNKGNYDISDIILNNQIISDISDLYNLTSYTLPLCYREGSPTHPSYPAGHAAIAGACCTILKIFFNCEQLWNTLPGIKSGILSNNITNLVEADATGLELVSYMGNDSNEITINGEINKLASNVAIGRNWAGVHYRSDGIEGINLGEKVAITYMEDMLSTMVENKSDGSIPHITFRRFNGKLKTIKPNIH